MASVSSIDKSLGTLSSWLSAAAFCGFVLLPYLPARPYVAPAPTRSAEPPAASASSPAVPAPNTTAPQENAAVPASPAAQAAAPSPAAEKEATYPAAAPPESWTQEELTAGLRQCVELLAPASMDIVMAEPMKRGQCGTPAPLALRSIGSGQKVEFSPHPTMNCHLAAKLGDWIEKVLQPAAQQELGSRIKRIIGASSYSCRNIYNNPLLKLSEHATGNAIDIAGFETVDGRRILVLKGWGPTGRDIAAAQKKADEAKAKAAGKYNGKDAPKVAPGGKGESNGQPVPAAKETPAGSIGKTATAGATGARIQKADFKQPQAAAKSVSPGPVIASNSKEARFLKRVHGGSCELFSTVLGPEANEAHRDHFHLDIKTRRSRGFCK